MKLRFSDGYEITIQQAIESSGYLYIKIINMNRESVLDLFRDDQRTKLLTVIDKMETRVYKKYTTFNYLTEHASKIIEICMIQEGKTDTELISELTFWMNTLLGVENKNSDIECVAMQFNRFLKMSVDIAMLPDEKAMEIADLYEEWKEKTKYAANKILKYGVDATGKTQLYHVVKDHVSQAHYPPDVDITHYKKIGFDEGGTQIWSQPLGQHDAYMKGDVVTHNGKTWISTVDNNVWEPGVYGWEVKK